MTASATGATLLASGISLGFGLIAIAWAERFDRARIAASVLFRRWATWVAITGVLTVAIAGGTWTLAALVAAMTAVAVIELRSLLRLPGAARLPATGAGIALVAGVALEGVAATVIAALAVGAIAAMDARRTRRPLDVALGAVGTLAIAGALASAVLVARLLEDGSILLVSTLFAVALGDVGAYIAGRRLGGPFLARRISPAKRWSGVLGNVTGALLAFAGFAALTAEAAGTWWLLAPAIGIASVGGDLLESWVKRHASVKDAGSWLPGFGGLLDRIDSSLAALPLVLVLAPWLGWEVLA
jgi:phosphatidate cytidylyltransferase